MGWFDEQIRDRKRNDDEAFAEAFDSEAVCALADLLGDCFILV